MAKKLNLKRLIIASMILLTSLLLFPGCSKKEKPGDKAAYKLNIAIVNRKNKAGKINPISVTVLIDDKEILKNKMMDSEVPLSIAKDLSKGNHSIVIKELATGAVYKNFLTTDKDYWLRVVFYSEGKGMGYFEGKIQTEPWGYEFEKSEETKDNTLKENKSREDDFDKKLDELRTERKEQDKDKKKGKDKKKDKDKKKK